jgi:hypothetical protein
MMRLLLALNGEWNTARNSSRVSTRTHTHTHTHTQSVNSLPHTAPGCCSLFHPLSTLPSGFLDRLRIELRLQGQLQTSLGLGPGLVQKLLQQRSAGTSEVGELRLDLAPLKQV